MKLLPYYLEDEGAKCSGAISLAENINVLNEEDALFISNYMSTAIVIDEWLSNVKDALSNKLEVPSKTWSDGEYIWDSLHIHYVEKYKARLPLNFINHVKKRVESGYSNSNLNKQMLTNDYEAILQKLAGGDESYYDTSF